MNIINRKDQTKGARREGKNGEEERRMWETKKRMTKESEVEDTYMEMRKEIHNVTQMHKEGERRGNVYFYQWLLQRKRECDMPLH